MAWTLGDIVSTVQTEIKDSAISTSTLKEWYNDTVREFSLGKRWRFFEATQPYTLTASTADITNGSGLPSTFQVANKLTNTTSGFEGSLTWTTFNDLSQDHPAYMNAADSAPYRVYEYGDTINVWPTPDTGYTVSLTYQKMPTEQTADGDVPEFSQDFREVIKLGIKKRFYNYRDKEDKAQLAQNQIDDLMIDLARRYTVRQLGQTRVIRTSNKRSSLVRG